MAVIEGGNGNDTLIGTGNDDRIEGNCGDDLIEGLGGEDTLKGGAGDDTLIGRLDGDEMAGGDGADLFVIDPAGAGDDAEIEIRGGAGGDDSDTLDLSRLLAAGWEIEEIELEEDDGGNPGFDGEIELVNRATGAEAEIEFSDIETIVICFTPGTMIATPTGERPVESLREGDRVFTRDNGVQEIRWTGRRSLTGAALQADPALRPVRIKAGSLGHNMPERDLLVSPSHRMLMTGDRPSIFFDESEVLAAAKHLTGMKGISKVCPARGVTYHHILFDRHEVILGNGAWTESFQPGDYALSGMEAEQRAEIVRLFPDLATARGRDSYAAARRVLRRGESDLLAG